VERSIQKCEHCSQWTDGNKAFCQHCGEMLDVSFRKERWELEKKLRDLPGFMEWVKIKGAARNPFLFVIEKLIQGGQVIITAIVALITFILLALPG
jgi:hypothetical protein